VSDVRLTEVLAALSLTTDLTSGLPLEEGVAICLVATEFARQLDFDHADASVVFYAALLRAIGCTSHAPENADEFGDDIAFEATLRVLDPGDEAVFGAQLKQFGSWAGAQAQPALAARFLEMAATAGPYAARSGCETSRALGTRLGMVPAVLAALDDVHERWDGLGIPDGRVGDELTRAGRIVHVAEQAVRARAIGGDAAAMSEVERRSGGHLDPELATAFARVGKAALATLDTPDLIAAVLDAEPGVAVHVAPGELDGFCLALSIVADLKSRYLIGHSAHVAALADSAAALSGVAADERAVIRAAALLHDLGRTAVPSSVWDRPGPLGAADFERVRLHPYWTERILGRCPGLAHLAPIAGAHHERLDGSGYHRGAAAEQLSSSARLLAAADCFATATEARPHRPALSRSDAAAMLTGEAAAGRIDRAACAAVIEASGLPRPKADLPKGLTEREVDVLRLAARGLSNRGIADELCLSDRTVGHHLAHVYDKIDRRTRAGAAVFAVEHGLLPG
jgi:HD-GYP domain-containing protein (c-di-GMP phosphodiesterase class II)/DNA-binding CsgD family transcriptional regulator